jgi:hypothetical protein
LAVGQFASKAIIANEPFEQSARFSAPHRTGRCFVGDVLW